MVAVEGHSEQRNYFIFARLGYCLRVKFLNVIILQQAVNPKPPAQVAVA
jgi:hypothetical protein